MKKLRELMERQSRLTAKMLAGNISADEKAQLARLTKTIENANKPHVVTRKTSLKTMTLSEFKKYVTEMSSGDCDADELAILKRNIDAVKEQGASSPDDVVAVEFLAQEKAEDVIAQLQERIAALEASSSATTKEDEDTDGDGETDPDEDGDTVGEEETEKSEKPTAMALAMEAIDTILANMTELKKKFEAGDVTLEEINKIWPQWEIRNLVDAAASIMTKVDTMKSMAEELDPLVKSLSGDDENEEDENSDSDASGDEAEDSTDDSSDSGEGETVDKSAADAVAAFLSGRDMAPSSQGGKEDYLMVKDGGKNRD